GGIVVAVALEGRAVFEHPAQGDVTLPTRRLTLAVEQRAQVDVEQRRRRARALDVTAELNEMPPFAARHRRIGDPLEEVRAFLDRMIKFVRLRVNAIDP